MTRRTDFQGHLIDLRKVRGQARVTDHAVLRYLERVEGLDLEAVRNRILSDAVLQAMIMRATSVHGHGFKLVIQDFTVVTTLPAEAVAAPARLRREDR